MDRYSQLSVATAIVLLAFSSAARAADVPYVSGGAGFDERAELLALGHLRDCGLRRGLRARLDSRE